MAIFYSYCFETLNSSDVSATDFKSSIGARLFSPSQILRLSNPRARRISIGIVEKLSQFLGSNFLELWMHLSAIRALGLSDVPLSTATEQN